MDPLSDVLSRLSTRHSFFAGLRAGGQWAIDFPPPLGIKFNAVVTGNCTLQVEGMAAPVHLAAGDCFLLSRGQRFSLSSGPGQSTVPAVPAVPTTPVIRAEDIYRDAVDGIAHCGTADELFLIGGRFNFGDEAGALFEGLPAVAIIDGGSEQASVLHWALQRLAHEMTHPSPGSAMVIEHLGHLMLLQVLRTYLAQTEQPAAGWLLAMVDPRIGAAIHAIHAQPAHPWRMEELAKIAGLSRSAFALRFKQKAATTPLDYVLRWRMLLAKQALRSSAREPISAIAQRLGYDSDSAFSHAFKRMTQDSPREYRARYVQP